MFSLVNLVHSATISIAILGAILIWQKPAFRGVACLLSLTAFAALINILEESGITRNIYLISPVFIILFGPAFYLAVRYLIQASLKPVEYAHLIPAGIALFFTQHVEWIIAIGSVCRLIYAALTTALILKYYHRIENERSDASEYSLKWLVYLVAATALFNLIDLVRLNLQQSIPHWLNVLGQGINNFVWLLAIGILVVMLNRQRKLPVLEDIEVGSEAPKESASEYQAVFDDIKAQIQQQALYLEPRLTLAKVSEVTGHQQRDISRAVNLVGQQSFNEFINQFRVRQVCDALAQGDNKSITDIAFEAGFSSKASFNKTFKLVTGLTPSEYKSQV